MAQHNGEIRPEARDLGIAGLHDAKKVYLNLTRPALCEEAIRRGEGALAFQGPLVVDTGQYTGRSPNDKFIVREDGSADKIWWGKVNRDISEESFDKLYDRATAYARDREIFVRYGWGGASRQHRVPFQIITDYAWHSMFMQNMLIEPTPEECASFQPEFTIIDMPGVTANPAEDGTNSEAYILLNLAAKTVLIGGTSYAGEMKKSVFTILNYLLPLKQVMPMHCSANVGKDGDTALFFGLSGTGKTTLSADPDRGLIGDDEHGWDEEGIFNFEGGCYAKVIKLSREAEPEIYATTEMFGTVLENVVMDPVTRELDLNDGSMTENTRACYPLTSIENAVIPSVGSHPKNLIMLTADAFGVLPPISRMTPAQAMYHFISGYTAKVAGTERGVTEPTATFSACFGAPFMALHPSVYAKLLGEKIAQHKVNCWLVNTGWTGGPYGTGSRMSIKYTRTMIQAALEGKLDDAPMTPDPFFGVDVPDELPGVPAEVLKPRNTWQNKDAYDEKAKHLVGLFHENFKKYAEHTSQEIQDAAPRV